MRFYLPPECFVIKLNPENDLLLTSENIDDLKDGGKLW